MKKALALTHVSFEHLGNLELVLKSRGYHIQYMHAPTADFELFNPLDADLLIVLGGPISVYEQDLYPFLHSELSFIKKRLLANLPTIGICLGAQFIAQAFGARVYSGGKKEIGWSTLTLPNNDMNSPMKWLENTPVLHWHGDTFDLPMQATLLASTDIYPNQAFKVGNSILGLQFHIELLPNEIENWLVGHACELSKANIDINQLRFDTQKNVAQLNAQAEKFWQEWLDLTEVASFAEMENNKGKNIVV